MKISFHCQECDRTIQAPATMAGRDSHCPNCSAVVHIPDLAEEGSTSADLHHACDACGRSLSISRQHAGKKVRCKCGAQLRINEDLSGVSLLQSPAVARAGNEADAAPASAPAATSLRSRRSTLDSDEPVLIPVDMDEPVLIPVDRPESNMAAAAVPIPKVQERRRGPYSNPLFIVSLVLGGLTFPLCLAAVLLEWMNIPQPPGSDLARGVGGILGAGQMMDEVLGKAPESPPFWAIPCIALLLVIVAVPIPRPSIRGTILFVAALVTMALMFLAIGWMNQYFLSWTPLARYVQTPTAFSTWRPPPPEIGLGVWATAAIIVLMLANSAANLVRDSRSAALLVGGVTLVGLLGFVHLNHWFLNGNVQLEAVASVNEPAPRPGIINRSASEINAVVTLVNRSGRPVVVVADDARTQDNKAQSWYSKWGEPDVVLVAKQESPKQAVPQSLGPRFTFEDSHALGCLLGEDESIDVVLRFSPVWKPGRISRPSMSGTWTLSLQDSEAQILEGIALEIPGIEHPLDRQIETQFDQLEAYRQEAKGYLSDLRQGEHAGIEELAGKLTALIQAIDGSQRAIAAIEMNRIPVPQEAKDEVMQFVKSVRPEAARVAAIATRLDKGAAEGKAREAQALLAANPEGELGEVLSRALPAILFAEVETLIDKKQYIDALQLLCGVEASALPAPVSAKVAPTIEQTLIAWQTVCQPVLIRPDGALLAETNLGQPVAGKRVPVETRVPRGRRPPRGGNRYIDDESAYGADYSSAASEGHYPVGGYSAGSGFSPGYGYGEMNDEMRGAAFTRSGTGSATGIGDLLRASVQKCVQLNPSSAEKEPIAYTKLISQQLMGMLAATDVQAFCSKYPASRQSELCCWLGVDALTEHDLPAAQGHFDVVIEKGEEDPYFALALLGKAITDAPNGEQDLMTRLIAERAILRAMAGRTVWASDVQQLLPQNLLCARLSDADWIEHVTVISSHEQLENWKQDQSTIPWFRFEESAEIPLEMADDIKQIATDDRVVIVGSQLFQTISHLKTANSSGRKVKGKCTVVTSWLGRSINLPFALPNVSFSFDSQIVFSTNGLEEDSHFIPLLAMNPQTVVSAIWKYPRGGVVILLPDGIEAVPDAHRFVAALVNQLAE